MKGSSIGRRTRRFLIVSIIGLIILGLIVFLWLGTEMGNRSESAINEISNIYMSEMSNQLQRKFESVIDLHLAQVDGVARRIEAENLVESEDSQKLREELMLSAEIRDFRYLGLYTKEGEHDTIYGEPIEENNQSALLEMLQKSDTRISSGINVNGEKLFLLGKEVSYPMKNGGVSDVLVIGIPMDSLAQMLALDEKEAILFSHIIDENGDFIIRSSEAYRDSYFERIREEFEEYNGKKPEQYVQELQTAMANRENYSTVIVVDGQHQHLYLTHLQHSEWYLLSVMPDGLLNEVVIRLGNQRQLRMLTAGGIMLAL